MHAHTFPDLCGAKKQLRRAIRQVPAIRREAGLAAAQLDAPARSLEAQPVKHRHRLEHRFEFVKTVPAFAKDVQQ